MSFFQVTFSDQAISEFNKLPSSEQLTVLEALGNLTPEELKKGNDLLGNFMREGIQYYRLRADEFRIYFEIKDEDILYCHYILHQHTLTDFIFRFKLPVSEEQMVEQHSSFWKYLDTLKK